MAEQGKEFRHIVRVVNADLDGNKPILAALRKIKGVGFVLANAVCHFSNVDKKKVTGQLSDAEVARLEDVLSNPLKFNLPIWLLNRRKHMETGEDKHLMGTDLNWQIENDVKMMKKTKSYTGSRHAAGLPVRGQQTKSNFRKKKGKSSLGVQRKKKGQPKK